MHSKPSPDESISTYLMLTQKYYGDVLDRHGLALTAKGVTAIRYENECFVLSFGYDYNQFGYMLFNGIGIGVKKTGREYWLGHVLQAITGDKNFDLQQAAASCIAQSPKGMTDLEAQRIVWEPYIADTSWPGMSAEAKIEAEQAQLEVEIDAYNKQVQRATSNAERETYQSHLDELNGELKDLRELQNPGTRQGTREAYAEMLDPPYLMARRAEIAGERRARILKSHGIVISTRRRMPRGARLCLRFNSAQVIVLKCWFSSHTGSVIRLGAAHDHRF
jgi:hypothetical protein